MKRFFILIVVISLFGCFRQSQKTLSAHEISDIKEQVKSYKKKLFVSDKDTLRYLQLINQKENEKMPLIIYLHSGDANGTDNEKQLIHSPKIVTDSTFRTKHSFYFIAPQCKPKTSWSNTGKWKDGGAWVNYKIDKKIKPQLALVKALIDSLIVTKTIDKSRIYIIGSSMGGFGVWDLICRFPNTFAAAVPVCGIADTLMAKSIVNTPIWVFHGGKDAHVDVQYSRIMVQAINNAGGRPQFTEFSDLPHDIRDTVYNNREVWDWMFLQKIKF